MNNEDEYIQFLNELKACTEAYFQGKVKGEICTTVKNNGVSVTGLLLKGENERVAPNFYLEQQFVEWMQGKLTLEDINRKLCQMYQSELKKSSTLLTDIRFEWEEFRRRVFLRLVNKERNKALLETIPYLDFLDLAIVYYYSVAIDGDTVGTMIINNQHLEHLNVGKEELHRVATSNCQRYRPATIRCMEDILRELMKKAGVDAEELTEYHPNLYVLSNASGTFGASAMVFEEELKHFSNQIGKSFYILPSSVHEVILVPESEEINSNYLSDMVKEVNETHVEATEVLSDSVYYYDKENMSLCKVE